MVAVPGETPERTPVPEPMDAMEALEDVHVPLPAPDTVSDEIDPEHVVLRPVTAPGCGYTRTVEVKTDAPTV